MFKCSSLDQLWKIENCCSFTIYVALLLISDDELVHGQIFLYPAGIITTNRVVFSLRVLFISVSKNPKLAYHPFLCLEYEFEAYSLFPTVWEKERGMWYAANLLPLFCCCQMEIFCYEPSSIDVFLECGCTGWGDPRFSAGTSFIGLWGCHPHKWILYFFLLLFLLVLIHTFHRIIES